MSLIGLVKQAIAGTATWSDVESKVEALAKTGALDVLTAAESFATAFWANFAPVEAKALAGDAGSVVSAIAGGTAIGTAVVAEGATVLSQTAANATAAAGQAINTVAPAV